MEAIKERKNEERIRRTDNGNELNFEQHTVFANDNAGVVREKSSVGKRFARRAKRWAELQNRRLNTKNCNMLTNLETLNHCWPSTNLLHSSCSKHYSTNENFFKFSNNDVQEENLLLESARNANTQHNRPRLRCACNSKAITDVTSIINSSDLLKTFGAEILRCEKCTAFVLCDSFGENLLKEYRKGPHAICGQQYKYYFPEQKQYQLIYPTPFYLLNANPQVRTMVSIYQLPPELCVYPQTNDNSDFELTDQVFKHGSDCSDYFSQSSCSSASLKGSPDNSRSPSASEDDRSVTYLINRRGKEKVANYNCLKSLSQQNSLDEISSAPSESPSPQRYGSSVENNSNRLSEEITEPPPDREWISVRHFDPEKKAAFTILSYNILSNRCTQRLPFTFCPQWALNWDYRCAHIVKEIKNYEADIFTLQEVETEDFYTFFLDEFRDFGYDGIYSPRTRARTMEEEGRRTVDGCAIFWKKDKFELRYHHTIEFTQVLLSGPITLTNRILLDKLLPRDNIALCAVLMVKEEIYDIKRVSLSSARTSDTRVVGYPLVVCTAHIYWDPMFSDIKLIQSMALMKQLTSFLHKIKDTFNLSIDQFPLVLCGDFNSLPESGLIEFITTGSVLKTHEEFKSTYDDCLEELTSRKDTCVYTHELKLFNAIERGYLEFTNFTSQFRGMIDYIFASSKRLTRLGFLGPIDQNWITNNQIAGFPFMHVPSDHIPIMAQFEIVPIDDVQYE